jgi:uncharacterized protein (DUF927 family)
MSATEAAGRRLWADTQVLREDTRAANYLEVDRGIAPDGAWPECLRFAPNLRHPCEQFFPALIVQASDAATGAPTGGVQRIFLGWKSGKAQVEKKQQKMALGPMKGAVARLAQPIDGKPLLIGEGVETVLSAMRATGLPGWATFGTSGLKTLAPPDAVKSVILLAENDGGRNAKALEALIPALKTRDVKVAVAKPPSGLKDFNDLVNGTSGHTPAAGSPLIKRIIEAAEAGGESPSSSSSAAADDDAGRSSPFSLTETGLWRRKSNGKWAKIAQPFTILGKSREPRDVRSRSVGWGRVVRFRDADGFERDEVVSAALLHGDSVAIAASLADKGMDIVCTPIARRNFAEYLVSADVRTRITVTPRTGWIDIDGKRVFALPDQIIGANGAERILFESEKGFYARHGALADWRDGAEGAGALARDHRLLRFAIATALTGPLLLIGGYEGAIVHFYGPSSEGKTTCLRVAASVWGSGADGGYMRVWRMTVNGLEGALAASCDTLLVLDEVGQTDGKDLGAAIYMAMSGIGKQRMQRDATLKAAHTWRAMGLSSGETPVEIKLTEHGGNAYAGHLVRALDIKASRTHGAFDALEIKPEAFADQVKHAASTFYGTAGPVFVDALIKHGVSKDDVRTMVDDFVGRVLKGVADYHGQAARAAQHFGLIAAAGELAARFNIVPWPEGEARADAEGLFEAWLSERGGSASHETRQAVSRVRHFLEAHGDSRFEDLDPPLVRTSSEGEGEGDPIKRRPVLYRAGYRRGEGDERRWLVLPEVFTQEICAGMNPTEAARTLAQGKMLVPGADGKFTRSEWVHGKTQRVYVLTPSVFEGWGEDDGDSDPVVDLFP